MYIYIITVSVSYYHAGCIRLYELLIEQFVCYTTCMYNYCVMLHCCPFEAIV